MIFIFIIFIMILTSCGSGNFAPNGDAVPYEDYKSFFINNQTYRVYKSIDEAKAISYRSYDLDLSTDKEEWIVNTMVDLNYLTTNNFEASQELIDEVYNLFLNDSILDSLSFTPTLKESGTYPLEVTLNNTEKNEISAKVFIAYYVLYVKTNKDSFFLSIPVYETIIKVDGDSVTDPFDGTLLKEESFKAKYSL